MPDGDAEEWLAVVRKGQLRSAWGSTGASSLSSFVFRRSNPLCKDRPAKFKGQLSGSLIEEI